MCSSIKSSDNTFGGGDRSTSSVSHRPLHVLRTLCGPKLAPSMTNATLKITLMPSQRKLSQIRSSVSHGSVRVIAHRNQSVIYSSGSTLCLSRCRYTDGDVFFSSACNMPASRCSISMPGVKYSAKYLCEKIHYQIMIQTIHRQSNNELTCRTR